MRKATVVLGDKSIEIEEQKVKFFVNTGKELIRDFKASGELKDATTEDLAKFVSTNYSKYLPLVVPGITEDDITDAYPSEIEELVKVWSDINFLALKNIYSLVKPLVLKALPALQSYLPK